MTDEQVIVDVKDVDWSRHPAWGSDFDASVMRVPSLDHVPGWAGDPVAYERTYVCEECGATDVNRESL